MAEPARSVYNPGMMKTGDAFRALSSLGEMRVWSLLITIFGDAVLPRGGRVPASALQAVLEQLGIKPEAMRVALHRLVKDGWVIREKSGRQSFYRLDPAGEQEFLTAQKRIYANAPALSDPWRLIVTQGAAPGFIPLAEGVALGMLGTDLPEDALVVTGSVDALPDWVMARLAPEPLPEEYTQLEDALEKAKASLPLDPGLAAALRILVIHQWRRLLLRHADLPAAFFPEHWRGEACRGLVLDLHASLSIQADPWFDAAVGAQVGS